jgi:hypothetical protein
MKKQSLFIGVVAFACAALVFSGCESPVGGSSGAAGAPGTIYLSGSLTSEGIQAAIDSGAPLVFAGVTQTITTGGEDTVLIPAGRSVTLIGDAAYTVDSSGVLILADAASVTGTGDIDDNGGTVIGPEGAPGLTLAFATPDEDGAIDFGSGTMAALYGDHTIGDGTGGTIDPANFGTNELYVVGDLTVSAKFTSAPTVIVFGDATVSADIEQDGATLNVVGDASVTVAQTKAVKLTVKGNLTASEAPTADAGTIDVEGDATFAKAISGITGTINVDGAAAFSAALTTGGALTAGSLEVTGAASFGGDVTVKGGATFASTVTNTAAAELTVGEATTITGVLSSGTGGFTIAGAGAVSLAEKPVVAASQALTVSNSGGVTLAKGIDVGVAGGLTVTGGTAAGKVIIPNGQAITITNSGTALFGSTAEVKLSGAGVWTATKAITIAGDSTTGVKITSTEAATFASSGTAPKLTLAASTALDIGATVTLALDGTANGIAFTGTNSTIVLNPGAKITGTAATTLEANSSTTTGASIKLTATDGTTASNFTFTTEGVVTKSTDAPSADVTLTLGKSDWKSTNAANSTGVTSTVAGTAAEGSLSAGTDTTVTLAGT